MPKSALRRFIPVFTANQDPNSLPAYALPLEEANALVAQGHATSMRRGKAIRLRKDKGDAPEIRGVSCKPNERLMSRFVDGLPYAVKAIEAWKPRFRVIAEAACN